MTAALLVEFCGLPGAGKSTLSAEVVRALTDAGCSVTPGGAGTGPDVPAPRRIPRKVVLAGTALRRREAAGTARHVAAVSSSGAHEVAARVLQWTATQGAYTVARRRGGTHVFDEGVLQSLWSVGLRADAGPLLDHLHADPGRWERPDLLVVVDEPTELALGRLHRRPSAHSRTQALSGAAQRAELDAGRVLLERLVTWWRDLPVTAPSPVVVVRPSEEGAASACRLVRGHIERLTGC